LRRLIPFAPLHMPGGIEGIETVAARHPRLPQVACFDTAYHRGMPERAERFPLPRELWDAGVRRYGFHGISYEYIMRALGADVPPRLIIAHLGNGASMAAVEYGRPRDTTMGFTPAGGFMMGTRPGDLDPGLILYLLEQKRFDAAQLSELVNLKSGLLGVSGVSSDVKTLLDARATNADATMAIEMFCYQIRKAIGALAAALGGLDLLVFTGGIGEHAAAVRAEVCDGLAHLGLAIDPRRNDSNEDTISTADSRCRVRVIPTNENLMVARHTVRLVFPTD
jgi:acetate kinase